MKSLIKKIVVTLFMLAAVSVPQVGWAEKGGNGNGKGGGGGCVPEIDPGMTSSAIVFLTGGVLMLTRKSARK